MVSCTRMPRALRNPLRNQAAARYHRGVLSHVYFPILDGAVQST